MLTGAILKGGVRILDNNKKESNSHKTYKTRISDTSHYLALGKKSKHSQLIIKLNYPKGLIGKPAKVRNTGLISSIKNF